jgi:hypothetical protein
MPALKCPARGTRPPCVRLRRSPRKTEILIEGTVPVLVIGLLAAVYIGYLLH